MLSTSKGPSLSSLGTDLKVELTHYCFILKVTRVFPIPTQAKQTEDGEHFLLMIKTHPACKKLGTQFYLSGKKSQTWIVCFFIGVALKLAVLVS